MISVRGPNSSEFLQNLISQDITLFEKEYPDRAAIMTSFMNPKGKVLFDAFVIKPRLAGQKEEPEYWIDVGSDEDSTALLRHLKRYAIRKPLVIKDISHIIKSY